MTYTARCFHCDWGLTHDLDVISECAMAHLDEGCPGPVVALNADTANKIIYTKTKGG